MGVSVRSFWLPKNGHNTEEYEDAFIYSLCDGRFAIADGATESSFARSWARDLVREFVYDPPQNGEWQQWLRPLQGLWREGINWDQLPWFAVEKAQQGAHATLLGFEFVFEASLCELFAPKSVSMEKRQWKAVAIGDSCLFHIQEAGLLTAFPIRSSSEFGSTPILLSSNSGQQFRTEVQYCSGKAHPGDFFILATDALAQWFLARYEAGERPWATLCNLESEEAFSSLVIHLRKAHLMRNDDVTLLVISLDPHGFSSDERRSGCAVEGRESDI